MKPGTENKRDYPKWHLPETNNQASHGSHLQLYSPKISRHIFHSLASQWIMYLPDLNCSFNQFWRILKWLKSWFLIPVLHTLREHAESNESECYKTISTISNIYNQYFMSSQCKCGPEEIVWNLDAAYKKDYNLGTNEFKSGGIQPNLIILTKIGLSLQNRCNDSSWNILT